MTFFKLIGSVAALALLAQPALAQQPSKTAASETRSDAPMIVAKVNGLVCDFCAQALRKVFKKEKAVASLNVDLDAGEVLIELKPGKDISDKTVAKLIRKSGYSLVSTKRINGA